MKAIIINLLLLVSFLSFGEGRVGNGSSEAQRNIIHAFTNIEHYIRLSLASRGLLTREERKVLENILFDLPSTPIRLSKLQFVSERLNRGTFIIGGEEKIAKTWMIPGADIYINKDLINYRDEEDVVRPISINAAVSLLIHELGHQQRISNCFFLDVLGKKVEKILSRGVEIFKFKNTNYAYKLYTSNGNLLSIGEMIFSNKGLLIDLTSEIKSEIRCFDLSQFKLKSLNFTNVHEEFSRQIGVSKIRFWASLICSGLEIPDKLYFVRSEMLLTFYHSSRGDLIDFDVDYIQSF